MLFFVNKKAGSVIILWYFQTVPLQFVFVLLTFSVCVTKRLFVLEKCFKMTALEKAIDRGMLNIY